MKAASKAGEIDPQGRQYREGEEAYQAYLVYRDLGPTRTMKAARLKLGRDSAGYVRIMESWSSKFRWIDRVRAWDSRIQEERDRERLKTAARWECRRLNTMEASFRLGLAMLTKASEALGALVPASTSARDAVALARQGSELAAAAIAAALGPKDEDAPLEAADGGMRPEVAAAALQAIAEATGVSLDDD